jgi:hypothetical protein
LKLGSLDPEKLHVNEPRAFWFLVGYLRDSDIPDGFLDEYCAVNQSRLQAKRSGINAKIAEMNDEEAGNFLDPWIDLPTLDQTIETEKFQVKFYSVSKRQIVFDDGEQIFYATFYRKGSSPPRYEHIPLGIPELERAIATFKKNRKVE